MVVVAVEEVVAEAYLLYYCGSEVGDLGWVEEEGEVEGGEVHGC